MLFIKRLNLQLFAEGGEGGGEGAATGVTSADAGQSRLLELGVPADKIRKPRAQKPVQTAPAASVRTSQQDAAAKTTGTEKASTQEGTAAPDKARMTWAEIMADPEYNAEMQKIMRERTKKSSAAEENMERLKPLISDLAKKYGQDPDNIDYDSLHRSYLNDDGTFEERALAEGKSIEDMRRQAIQTLEQQKINRHIQSLEAQGEEMKKIFPNFDLKAELRNQTFARMTAPSGGVSVEDAYYAVHRKEIQAAAMHVTAQKTAQQISNSIQAGQRRPDEHGTSAQAASVTSFDYSKASKAERESIKKRIRDAAARGEKIYPGQF